MKFKLFYGWYIVGASLVLMILNSAILVYGFTAFVDPILATFSWSVTQLSLASSLRSLENGVFNPIWGSLADRWPARRLMLIGITATALGIFVLSRTVNLGMYYAGFLVIGIGSSLSFGVLPTVVLTRWFRRDIGKANGVFATGAGLGGILVPVVVNLVDKYGWQNVLLYVAGVYLVIGIPLAFVYINRPEDIGLVPDGKADSTAADKLKSARQDFGTSIRQALRMRAFWYINMASFFQMMVVSTISIFVIPHLTHVGVERAQAGMVVSLFTFISLFTRIPFGILADKFNKKIVMAVTMGLFSIGMYAFFMIKGDSPFWLTLLFATGTGAAIGSIIALRAPLQIEYFGTRNFGVIFGVISIASTVGGVLSAPVAGWIYDTYGSYSGFWLGLGILGTLMVLLMLNLPASGKKGETANLP